MKMRQRTKTARGRIRRIAIFVVPPVALLILSAVALGKLPGTLLFALFLMPGSIWLLVSDSIFRNRSRSDLSKELGDKRSIEYVVSCEDDGLSVSRNEKTAIFKWRSIQEVVNGFDYIEIRSKDGRPFLGKELFMSQADLIETAHRIQEVAIQESSR